jgi:hypothetical protein
MSRVRISELMEGTPLPKVRVGGLEKKDDGGERLGG